MLQDPVKIDSLPTDIPFHFALQYYGKRLVPHEKTFNKTSHYIAHAI